MDVTLHTKQSEVFNCPAKYKVVAAGRRFGKSFLAATLLFTEAAKKTKIRSDGSEYDLTVDQVLYVAPTFKQAKTVLWRVCLDMGQGLIKRTNSTEGVIELRNGRIIQFGGADDPDSLRGPGYSFVVLDEYAFMKPEAWEYVIFPATLTPEGEALFIGTPEGKNHFYDLHQRALNDTTGDWQAFTFVSLDNPFNTRKGLDALVRGMSEEAIRQELEASFEASSGKVFRQDQFSISDDEPYFGEYIIACDLAGFSSTGTGREKKMLDDHALAVVKVHEKGWYVKEIIHGQWDIRETALRILRAWQRYRPIKLGIEKGMAMNAVLPYLQELQAKHGLWFEVEPLAHGNNKKEDRIKWALQGRADEGKIVLAPGEWNRKFIQQAVDFPNPLSHDDLIDALSYVDQLADFATGWNLSVFDEWQPMDSLAGV